MTSANERTIASVTHLSSFAQYIFPLGNFIAPIIIWSAKKNDSEFVDFNGKQILNFQLSIFTYSLILVAISLPLLIYGFVDLLGTNMSFSNFDIDFDGFQNQKITALIGIAIVSFVFLIFLKIFEFILIINAAVKASNGENYKYPLTIPFFK
ncbi:DUF4870 domain-containing protein [Flavobacterium aquatile]|uniref:DUF4870 domain-containing protein n=1 Tax=Flavobacterium aquatile LMG 4008 = ATCC 11947 TaxID=1453498 RepID=A0A095SUX9_9FLAO|nr:DUF4870 domain-containing protein [Flavobacterium aquatile]KGD68412.1 hypothetical protein LG45_09005 [Flavobacterium aquatile LMG 4008 = ATCC 11947]OXA68660.1 hypothetical protein B0A61_02820 [Flavobacterium aquatile LMG 4008 = ATCC 11947]GEC79285.1 hypothetical protein FAQ01_21550 [Flavobacterium aquatile]